jgi:hypothetical protein
MHGGNGSILREPEQNAFRSFFPAVPQEQGKMQTRQKSQIFGGTALQRR